MSFSFSKKKAPPLDEEPKLNRIFQVARNLKNVNKQVTKQGTLGENRGRTQQNMANFYLRRPFFLPLSPRNRCNNIMKLFTKLILE